MKKISKLFYLFVALILLFNCEAENGLEAESMKLAEGTWHGDFANSKVVFTIIEGIFEESITITGTAYLTTDTSATAYQIMNGNRNKNSLTFALYSLPIKDKEEYHIQGEIKNQYFEGSFDHLDSNGKTLHTGEFTVERIP